VLFNKEAKRESIAPTWQVLKRVRTSLAKFVAVFEVLITPSVVGDGGRQWETVGDGGRRWETVGDGGRRWETVGELSE
jgi:hypothetical protein